jgi:hypothetical protein
MSKACVSEIVYLRKTKCFGPCIWDGAQNLGILGKPSPYPQGRSQDAFLLDVISAGGTQ